MNCYTHPEKNAKYQCSSCQLLVCEECVKSFQAGGFLTFFCPGCNGQCDEIEEGTESGTVDSNPDVSTSSADTVPKPQSKKEEIKSSSEEDNELHPPLKKKTSDSSLAAVSSLKSDALNKAVPQKRIDGKVDSKDEIEVFSSLNMIEKSEVLENVRLAEDQLKKTDASQIDKPEPTDPPVLEGGARPRNKTLKKEILSEDEAVAISDLKMPSIISLFTKIFIKPEVIYNNGVFYLSRSVPLRMKFIVTSIIFLLLTAFLRSFESFFISSFSGLIVELSVFSFIIAYGIRIIGKIDYSGSLWLYVFGVYSFFLLLQHLLTLSLEFCPLTFDSMIIGSVFMVLKLFVFVYGPSRAYQTSRIASFLLFLIAVMSSGCAYSVIIKVFHG